MLKKLRASNRLRKLLPVPGFALILLLTGCDDRYVMFNPAGPVAMTLYDLIKLSVLMLSLIVIPVMLFFFYVVYRYRDKPGNKASYRPEWDDSKIMEIIWWTIPVVIVAILSVATVRDTYGLTKKPSPNKPITIEVVSLDWKWLFLYPEQNIATVNHAPVPAGVPVQFVLTSDAPMNSFWVPELGGQLYTMPGMEMPLWLQADKPGVYEGKGANFTGKGFAHMNFEVIAKPQAEFDAWAESVKKSAPAFTQEKYDQLKQPGLAKEQSYSSYPPKLYKQIVDKNGGIYWDKHDMDVRHESVHE